MTPNKEYELRKQLYIKTSILSIPAIIILSMLGFEGYTYAMGGESLCVAISIILYILIIRYLTISISFISPCLVPNHLLY